MTFEEMRHHIDTFELWEGDAESYNIAADHLARSIVALLAEVMKVKPLEWDEHCKADVYSVNKSLGQGPMRYFLARGDRIIGWHDQESDAKAAAQADYEQRIISALSTPPQPEEQGEIPADVLAIAHKVAVDWYGDRWLGQGDPETDAFKVIRDRLAEAILADRLVRGGVAP